MIPTFKFELGRPVLPGLAVIGKFNGKHPSLAAATTADNILIHSPHATGEDKKHEVRTFSVNRQISAVACGDLRKDPENPQELLLFGTHTNLVAYDVEKNSELFYKEVPENVCKLVYAKLTAALPPLAVVGGNCSVQGFDADGEEQFWTVSGDNVSAMNVRDVKKDGTQQLMIGCEDFEIRIMEDDELILEVSETDAIAALSQLHGKIYAFALSNGTIGVYNDETRIWHAKSKHSPVSLISFDLDSDGVPELITGWSNGRMEVRNDENGELVYKDKFSSSIAQIMSADYRMDNREEVVVCSVEGDMRGYLPAGEELNGNLMDTTNEEGAMQQLYQRKQELLQQLGNYENNLKQVKSGKGGAGTIPADTTLNVTLKPSLSAKGLVMTLSTNNDTVLKVGIVISDVLFEEGCRAWHPARPSSTMKFVLCPQKNTEVDIVIKAVVGHKSSTQEHVFVIAHKLNRFGSYINFDPAKLQEFPKSNVSFQCTERVSRIALWINSSFHMDDIAALEKNTTDDSLKAAFRNVSNRTDLVLICEEGMVKIHCENMELAGDVIQDMCSYLGIDDMESVCHFPKDMEEFREVLTKVEEHNSIRLRLSTEIADSSNQVKTLVIKAEDARIINEMKLMGTAYSRLYDLNQDLIGEYQKRANNHHELLTSLKDVNQMIQKAAKLRMGEPKSRVVSLCRKAIRSDNIQSLFKIVTTGNAGPGE